MPSVCIAEICSAEGALCPPGRRCSAQGDEEGRCEAPQGPATCSSKRRCPSDKPICVIAGATLKCVAEGSPAYEAIPGTDRLRCTRQSDCHYGDTCQAVFGEIEHETATYCGPYHPMYMGSRLCDPADQARCAPQDHNCRERHACKPPSSDSLLPWMGVR